MRVWGRLPRRIRLLSERERCVDSLGHPPIALYHEPTRLAVLFNAKAGCTFAAKWFYFQAGLLEEAQAYSEWPHRYRQDVLYPRPGYRQSLRAVPTLGERAVKFVRDPYERAVSSYLEYCEQAAGETDPRHTRVLRAIGEHLGRPVGDGAGLTFREFVSFLAILDLEVADPHVRRQLNACERAGLLPGMTVIRVEQSQEVLPEVEARLGLRASDYDELRRSPHHTSRADLPGFFGDTLFGQTRIVETPRTRSFYDGALIDEVGRLYADDCRTYGYTAPSPASAG